MVSWKSEKSRKVEGSWAMRAAKAVEKFVFSSTINHQKVRSCVHVLKALETWTFVLIACVSGGKTAEAAAQRHTPKLAVGIVWRNKHIAIYIFRTLETFPFYPFYLLPTLIMTLPGSSSCLLAAPPHETILPWFLRKINSQNWAIKLSWDVPCYNHNIRNVQAFAQRSSIRVCNRENISIVCVCLASILCVYIIPCRLFLIKLMIQLKLKTNNVNKLKWKQINSRKKKFFSLPSVFHFQPHFPHELICILQFSLLLLFFLLSCLFHSPTSRCHSQLHTLNLKSMGAERIDEVAELSINSFTFLKSCIMCSMSVWSFPHKTAMGELKTRSAIV